MPEPTGLRFGLIGCGDIGRVRAAALAAGAHRLTVVSDVDTSKARDVAGPAGAAVLTEWRELVTRDDVDAVIISTPPMLHEEMAIRALEAGKHVLCEKPLARTPEECSRMLAAAAQNGRVLATGFNYRFYPSFALARELLDAGAIGELSHIRSYGGYSATGHNQPWVHDADVVGGGALHDIGIHMIDLTQDFLGDVEEVVRFASGSVWRFGCEDNGFLLMRSADGRIASLHASWTEWGKYRFLIELVGSRGTIRASCFPMRLELLQSSEPGGRRAPQCAPVPRRLHRRAPALVPLGGHAQLCRRTRRLRPRRPRRTVTRGQRRRRPARPRDRHGCGPRPRRRRRAGRPVVTAPLELSVCVIQFTSRQHLVRCLEALAVQLDERSEVIVPTMTR
jgi:predicted dehydrogenase